MATVSDNPPFNAYRTHAAAALRMLSNSQQWSEQLLALQRHRLARDQDALRGTLEVLRDSHDWNEFATGSQTVLRDYLSASAAIWQEGVAAAMQGAGAWSDTTRDALLKWQDTLDGLQPGAAGGSAIPMREWMAAFEKTVNTAEPANGDATEPAAAKTRESRSRGSQHAG